MKTDVRDEQPPKGNKVSLALSYIKRGFSSITSCTNKRFGLPNISQKVVGLRLQVITVSNRSSSHDATNLARVWDSISISFSSGINDMNIGEVGIQVLDPLHKILECWFRIIHSHC